MKMRLAAIAAVTMMLTSLFAGGSQPVSAAATTPTLTAGTYNMYAYVSNVTETSGTGCGFTQGHYYGWFLYYPGLGKAGAIFRTQDPTVAAGYVTNVTLPKTPPKAGTSWTGSYTGTVGPGAIYTWTGAFTQTIEVVDAYSFGGTLTFTNWPDPGSSDKCTVTLQTSYVWSGSGG